MKFDCQLLSILTICILPIFLGCQTKSVTHDVHSYKSNTTNSLEIISSVEKQEDLTLELFQDIQSLRHARDSLSQYFVGGNDPEFWKKYLHELDAAGTQTTELQEYMAELQKIKENLNKRMQGISDQIRSIKGDLTTHGERREAKK